jgi:hypothetical protein
MSSLRVIPWHLNFFRHKKKLIALIFFVCMSYGMFRNASKEKKFTRNRTPAIKWQKKMLNFLRVLALKLIIDAIFLFKKKIKGSEKKENFLTFLLVCVP